MKKQKSSLKQKIVQIVKAPGVPDQVKVEKRHVPTSKELREDARAIKSIGRQSIRISPRIPKLR